MAVIFFVTVFFVVYGVLSLLMRSLSVLFVLISGGTAVFLTACFKNVFSSTENARQWKEKQDARILRLKENFIRIRVFLLVAAIGAVFRFPLTVWPVLFVLCLFVSKYEVDKWKSSLNNLMVTLNSPEGNFRTVWVNHPPGDNVWCISFDKADKGLAMKRVALKDNKEGFLQVEYGTKKAVLFLWNGNADAPGKNKVQFFYHDPGHGIPRDAEVLTDVKFN